MKSLQHLGCAVFTLTTICLSASAPVLANSPVESSTQPIHISTSDATKWSEKELAGNTLYNFDNNGEGIIHSQCESTASLLYQKRKIDLTKTPWVTWRWKIRSTYGEIDERTKAGDDYPARFYVTTSRGVLPWDVLAINYVWSSSQSSGSSWTNAFTDKAKVVALQSGDTLAGQWVTEKRNIVEDFKDLFDIDVKDISGFAIMVDGDNTNSAGEAWFRDISFSAE